MSKIKVKSVYLILFFLQFSFAAKAQDKLIYVADIFPPNIVADEQGRIVGGKDFDLMQIIAERLNVELEVKECVWVRCLDLLKEGKADIASSVSLTEDRQTYLHFLQPPFEDNNRIIFLLKKRRIININNYAELSNLIIGQSLSYNYFEQFDNDTQLKKYALADFERLFEMLEADRIDTLIGFSDHTLYMAKKLGISEQIKIADYKIDTPGNAFVALSKKSPFVAKTTLIEEVISFLINSGEWKKIEAKYN